ncbi:RecX family transcriptional regulator [Caldilinea sp.]|jgi:regulatory protein|uniref:RecX family transcriptional regulator n=1 Tax=Caldilinea sp. TaxID=2293560 RepID=UPI0021DCE4D5|nr:RecX family transcriptional regulator [Caldilinea sp.]GIV69102.1 MAG: regulatory protein RecX [Caldilinea sp.]
MAGVITRLQVQKNNPQRVNVFLDGEFAFGVTLDVAASLRKGQRLSDAEIAALRSQDAVEKAYQAALRFLASRPRSRAEVERRLAAKGHAAEAIAPALERLEAHGYLDDASFAAYWVENRSRFRPRSAAAVRHELRQKGVDAETIRSALGELDEDEAAWAAVAQRLERWRGLTKEQLTQKIMNYLARRGFGYEIAQRTARRAWAQLQSPNDL